MVKKQSLTYFENFFETTIRNMFIFSKLFQTNNIEEKKIIIKRSFSKIQNYFYTVQKVYKIVQNIIEIKTGSVKKSENK